VPSALPNFEANKAYIDLAADMGWEYQLIGRGWYGPQNGRPDRPIRAMKWGQTLAHAKKRGVGLWVWNRSDAAFAWYKDTFGLYRKWGIVGVQADSVRSDDQATVNKLREVLAAAADNRLMVSLHGVSKPTGIRRTFPNLLTRKAAARYVTPTQRCIIPFTRMLAGPLDYAPAGFRSDGLAMMVVYESPLLSICDHPDNYRTADTKKSGWETGVGFMKTVPATWDDTKVLGGRIGEYITIARKSGSDWFLGALTNEQPRELQVPLAFLGDGRYTATIWKDAPDSDAGGTKIVRQTLAVNAAEKLRLTIAPGGGVAIHFAAGK